MRWTVRSFWRWLVLATAAFGLMACQTAPPPTITPTTPPPSTATQATATAVPTATASPPATETAVSTIVVAILSPTSQSPQPSTHTPAPSPTPVPALNGILLADLLWIPPQTAAHIQEVYALGQTLGRDPHHFSKLGDSIIATPNFLARFDHATQYQLGPYTAQQETLDYYAGSWQRYGVAVRIGLSAWGAFDPMWASKEWCQPNEAMLACEIRLHNPSLLLIHLGTNDTNSSFERYLGEVVQVALAEGIIPILYTKADRFEAAVYPDDNHNNQIIRATAAAHHIPLIEFDLLAATLPNRGLGEDNVHLTAWERDDYADPVAYETGHAMHNLLTLLMLHEIRNIIQP